MPIMPSAVNSSMLQHSALMSMIRLPFRGTAYPGPAMPPAMSLASMWGSTVGECAVKLHA